MLQRWFAALLALGAWLGAAPTPAGQAEERPGEEALEPQGSSDQAPEPTLESAGIGLQDAIAIVRQAYGGRVVSAKADGDGYRVRVDVDGHVKTVRVDARGRIDDATAAQSPQDSALRRSPP